MSSEESVALMGDFQKRPKAGERREEILAAALRLFAQHGMATVTTRAIAQAVGISQPSLYAHFSSAAAIGEELCKRGFEVLEQRMRLVLAEPGDAGMRLHRLGRAYVGFALEQPDLYRIAFMLEDPACADLAPDDAGMAAGLQAFAALRAVVAELRGADDAASEALAQSIWACVHGLAALLIARPHFPWVAPDVLIDLHLEMLRDAVLARIGT